MRPVPPTPPAKPATVNTLTVLLCFFASGFAALTYEIAWIRKATLVFGSTSLALSTVLAVFFLGWAIGSRQFGRASTRTDRPLRLFARLEIAIGVFGLLSPWAFGAVESLYGSFYPSIYESSGTLNLTRAALLTACLILPTVLMGGTLPLLCRHFAQHRDGIMSTVGGLYGLNTLGGAVGCAMCGFWFIPDLGVDTAIFIAAGLNLVLGVVVFTIAPVAPLSVEYGAAEPANDEDNEQFKEPSKAIYLLFLATGFIALSNEVIWARYLSLLVTNGVHTYTLTLTVILVGIGLGGPLAGALLRRTRDGALPFGLVQIALGLLALTLLLYPINWWVWLAVGHAQGDAPRLVMLVVSLMLGPAILMGMTFPLAVRVVVDRPLQTGAGVGALTFVTTIGGVFGSLTTGFYLLPGPGLQTTILAVTGASLAVGILAFFVIRPRPGKTYTGKVAIALITVPIWIALASSPPVQVPRDLLGREGSMLAFEEGVNGNLAVLRSEGSNRLEIDGLWQGESRPSHLMMSAHVPMLLHPEPKNALVIGLGTGQAARRFLHYDIDRLDCVEIEGELPDMLRSHFDARWLDDEKVRILEEDGRSYLTHTDQEYDVISIAVGQTYRPGVASFYTREFYERAKSALRPKGCVSQFIPTHLLTTAEFRTLVGTFLGVFPQSVLWYNTEEMLLIGRDVDSLSISLDRLELLNSNRTIHEDLKFTYWGGIRRWVNRPESLLGGYLLGPKELAKITEDVAPYTDDRPWIEYTTAQERELDQEQSRTLDLIYQNLGPLGEILNGSPGEDSVKFTEKLREQNLADLRAVTLWKVVTSARRLKPEDVEAMLRKAIEWSPENVRIRRTLVYFLMDRQREDEALKLIKETLEIDPGDPISHNARGNVLASLDRQDEAIKAFERAIGIDSRFETAHLNLGQIFASRRAFDKATPHLKISVEQDPSNPEAQEWYGRALGESGKVVEAVEHLSEAMRLAPGSPSSAQALVWLLATSEHPDIPSAAETIAMAEQMARATRRQSPAVLDILAASYARAGRFADAKKSATQAIDLAKEQKKPELAANIESRRKLYESGKPFLK